MLKASKKKSSLQNITFKISYSFLSASYIQTYNFRAALHIRYMYTFLFHVILVPVPQPIA
jgi:hypothetical protein